MEEDRSFDVSSPTENEKVVINVGGQRHETYSNTLKSIPDTRLFWITENPTQLAEYDPNTQEYFFDRHPGVFSQVLNFYRTGKLHCPNDVCGPLFEEELAFWGIDELQVEPCCWLNYKKHREAQAHLDPFEGRDSDGESLEDMDMSIYGLVGDSIRRRNRTCWKTYQPKIWTLFEEPYSSIPAQILAFLALFLIITSVAIFCLETMPYFSDPNETPYKVIYYIETVCVAAFTIEFLIRLIVCPKKLAFLKVPMNWIDFGAILPFYLQIMLNKSNVQTMVVFRVIRLIRVFRIFKLSRHSYGLQILGHTLKSSCSELFLLAFFLSIGVIIFSSIIYYAEKDETQSHFKTIPDGFWWAVVTMTTLGYGDMVPQTTQGKIVGSLCAVSGVLMIALPVPVIVSNFSLYYSHAKARMILPKRKRPLIFGAASALRVAHPFAVAEKKPNVITQLMEERAMDGDDSENPEFSRRTPRSSGRNRTSRTLEPTTIVVPPRLSPRGSISSPQEPNKSSNLAVPELHSNVEQVEGSTSRRSSFVSHPIPQVVLSSSADPIDSSSQPMSPVTRQLSDNSSLSSLNDRTNAKSPTSKKRSIQRKSLSADSCHTGSPRGRRGRRGSIYIVGFTAKHWQNKALSKNKERKTLSADNSTEMDEPKSRGGYYSLSCENCDTNRKARSAEVLLSTDTPRQNWVENPSPRSKPRRDSVTVQTNPRIVTYKSLNRTSSGTQTSGTCDLEPVDTPSLAEQDSSLKTTDDSLCVHRHLSQRRGSSPLRRQHAVFIFDVNEQTSPKQQQTLEPVRVVNQATSPTLPFLENSHTSERREKNADSPSPPFSDVRRNSSRNSKVRPKSMSSSYVNVCYQREDDDPISQNPRSQSAESRITIHENHEEKMKPLPPEEKRGFQPYRKESQTITTNPGQTHHSDSELAEPECKDHYSRGRRTPLGSVSNASLPSISEEQAANSHVENSNLRDSKKSILRPHSMPSGSFDKSIQVLPVISRASSLPLTNLDSMDDDDVIAIPHPDCAHVKNTEDRRTLLQRRKGPELSIDSSGHLLGHKHLDVVGVKYPWVQTVFNSSRAFRTVDGVVSVADLDHFTSGPSPLASDYTMSADERLLLSPHTPPSLISPKTRDMATSPFITVWNESEEGPEPIPEGNHTHPTSRDVGKKAMRSKNTSSPSGLEDLERGNSLEIDQGRQYALYDVHKGLDQNCRRRDSETFGLPSGSVRDHFVRTSERIRNHSQEDARNERTEDSSPKQTGSQSPRVQQTDNSVIYNGHEPLQQRLSGSLLVTKRPASLPSPDRRKARTLFFGDSGISSVGSGSTTSMSHSLELDTDSKDRKESAANILNPIKETEVESSSNKKKPRINIMLPVITSRDNTVIDLLTNPDLYEASIV